MAFCGRCWIVSCQHLVCSHPRFKIMEYPSIQRCYGRWMPGGGFLLPKLKPPFFPVKVVWETYGEHLLNRGFKGSSTNWKVSSIWWFHAGLRLTVGKAPTWTNNYSNCWPSATYNKHIYIYKLYVSMPFIQAGFPVFFQPWNSGILDIGFPLCDGKPRVLSTLLPMLLTRLHHPGSPLAVAVQWRWLRRRSLGKYGLHTAIIRPLWTWETICMCFSGGKPWSWNKNSPFQKMCFVFKRCSRYVFMGSCLESWAEKCLSLTCLKSKKENLLKSSK